MNQNNLSHLDHISKTDVNEILEKEKTYKGSWKKRGGVGAFMMLARKWDRIENMMQKIGCDIFALCREQDYSGEDGKILAEVRDLRRYLLLVESEMLEEQKGYSTERPETIQDLAQDFLYRQRFTDSGIAGIPDPEVEERLEAGNTPPESDTTDHYDRVHEFMQLANQNPPKSLCVPPQEVLEARAKLLLEECLETIEAMGVSLIDTRSNLAIKEEAVKIFADVEKVDLKMVADGCADVSVINTGTMIAFGIKDKPLLKEVDEANLRKFVKNGCPNKCSTYETAIRCQSKGLLTCKVCNSTWPSGYLLAGKWIKPANFQEPNIVRAVKGLEEMINE